MLNSVLAPIITSELRFAWEWYHLNRKIIFYRSKRSKTGPVWSKWGPIYDLSKQYPKNNEKRKKKPSFFFGVVPRCFSGRLELPGPGSGLFLCKNCFSRKCFFGPRNHPDRPGPAWRGKKTKTNIEKYSRTPGPAGQPDYGISGVRVLLSRARFVPGWTVE